MPVNTVDMVRRIRDRHYKETKDLSPEDQIRYVRERSKRLSRDHP